MSEHISEGAGDIRMSEHEQRINAALTKAEYIRYRVVSVLIADLRALLRDLDEARHQRATFESQLNQHIDELVAARAEIRTLRNVATVACELRDETLADLARVTEERDDHFGAISAYRKGYNDTAARLATCEGLLRDTLELLRDHYARDHYRDDVTGNIRKSDAMAIRDGGAYFAEQEGKWCQPGECRSRRECNEIGTCLRAHEQEPRT